MSQQTTISWPCPHCEYEIAHPVWVKTHGCPKCGWTNECPQCGVIPLGANPNDCALCRQIAADIFGILRLTWKKIFLSVKTPTPATIATPSHSLHSTVKSHCSQSGEGCNSASDTKDTPKTVKLQH